MVATLSTMLPLGTQAPDFKLKDTVSGDEKSLKELTSPKGTVIMFICNHCPFVRHIQKKLVEIAKNYKEKGISFIAINSNDVAKYPEDDPSQMKKIAEQLGYPFPYLFDETQEVAKAYQAACTPDFFLFDGTLHCVYRGRFDGATPGNYIPVTGDSLILALEALLKGISVLSNQKPSLGCNIKWKS